MTAEDIVRRLEDGKAERFVSRLLEWFSSNARGFPWRRETDPYKILVAEKLLQQTTYGHVMKVYDAFFQKFPNIQSLAQAEVSVIEDIIRPLGFQRQRAKQFRKIGSAVLSEHRGRIPSNKEDLLKLRGIGDYVTNAVLCFAFNRDESIVDVNVRRVIGRYFGWKEIEGIHNRGDWDLSNHAKYSGKDLKYYDEETKEKYFPYIVETSGGVDRSLFVFLIDGYQEVKGGRTKTTEAVKEIEVLLKIHKKLVPIKVAVLPLAKNKPQLVEKAKEVYEILKPHFSCQYDQVGSIGRRYRRQDEIGTLYCVTVDFDSLEKDDVTIRNRDTMKQERIKIKDLINIFKEKLGY